MTARISDAARPERTADDEQPSEDLGELVQQWTRVIRALQRQRDADPARKWVRVRAIDVAVHSIAAERARGHEADLSALGQAVQGVLDELEPGMAGEQIDELERCLELRWERDGLERKLADARAALAKSFEERSQRRVREWFAESLPVTTARGEPIPSIESTDAAERALAAAEARATAAEAACPPKPSKDAQESLSDWGGPREAGDRPSDPVQIEENAKAAREALKHLPKAGPEPMWVEARDVPFAFKIGEVTWWGALVAALLTTAIAVLGLVMSGRSGEEAGLWRGMQLLAGAAWVIVVTGFIGKRVADAVLSKKHAAWLERCGAIDRAHRAIGWAYVVRRAEVEQALAEARALRDYIAASERLAEFDADPELGKKLTALSSELAQHVDGASPVLRWATEKGWLRA